MVKPFFIFFLFLLALMYPYRYGYTSILGDGDFGPLTQEEEWLIYQLPADRYPYPDVVMTYSAMCMIADEVCVENTNNTIAYYHTLKNQCWSDPDSLCFLQLARVARLLYPCRADASCSLSDYQARSMSLVEASFGNMRLAVRYALQTLDFEDNKNLLPVLDVLMRHGYCDLTEKFITKIELSQIANKIYDLDEIKNYQKSMTSHCDAKNSKYSYKYDLFKNIWQTYGTDILREFLYEITLPQDHLYPEEFNNALTQTYLSSKDLYSALDMLTSDQYKEIIKSLKNDQKNTGFENFNGVSNALLNTLGVFLSYDGQICETFIISYREDNREESTIPAYLSLALNSENLQSCKN